MPKSNESVDNRPVLITVRQSKRGYIVESAGSNDPYPCKDSDDIGEAIIDILNDPDTQRMEDAGAPEPPRSRSSGDEEEYEEEEYDPQPNPGAANTADEILAGALSMLLEKGRKLSHRGPK
jgi:hypothetical protein